MKHMRPEEMTLHIEVVDSLIGLLIGASGKTDWLSSTTLQLTRECSKAGTLWNMVASEIIFLKGIDPLMANDGPTCSA